MISSKPLLQHADAIHSGAFTGNLQRAALLPGEIAVRPPVSQEIRAAAGTGGYSRPAGASLYQRLGDGGPMIRDRERVWWHWPVVIALGLAVYGFIQMMSGGDDIATMLHKLI